MRPALALLPALALATPATPALAQQAQPARPPASLTLEATGEVRAAPDMATIATGVTTQGETAREALDANSQAMDALIAVLTGAGIEERDIQTAQFSVNPQYAYSEERDDEGYTRPPRITGYEVSNSVTITVRDIDSLGAVLDQAVSVGANTINGISFSSSDPSAARDTARRRAIEAALAKAEVYVDSAGITLAGITNITERDQGGAPQPMRAQAMSMSAESSVPIQGGELTYSVTTTVTWAIEDAGE